MTTSTRWAVELKFEIDELISNIKAEDLEDTMVGAAKIAAYEEVRRIVAEIALRGYSAFYRSVHGNVKKTI